MSKASQCFHLEEKRKELGNVSRMNKDLVMSLYEVKGQNSNIHMVQIMPSKQKISHLPYNDLRIFFALLVVTMNFSHLL